MYRYGILYCLLILCSVCSSAIAWNIGDKTHVSGPILHTTYFITPQNQSFKVHAQAHLGVWNNGQCVYNAIYDIGTQTLATGDFVNIDAYELKAIVGGGYSCMAIYYTYSQLVVEKFQIFWNGINYTFSLPAATEVIIL